MYHRRPVCSYDEGEEGEEGGMKEPMRAKAQARLFIYVFIYVSRLFHGNPHFVGER